MNDDPHLEAQQIPVHGFQFDPTARQFGRKDPGHPKDTGHGRVSPGAQSEPVYSFL